VTAAFKKANKTKWRGGLGSEIGIRQGNRGAIGWKTIISRVHERERMIGILGGEDASNEKERGGKKAQKLAVLGWHWRLEGGGEMGQARA